MNKKSIGLALFLICSLLLAAPMYADIVLTGSGGSSGFIAMPSPSTYANGNAGGNVFNPNQGGLDPYWNHSSLDASGAPSGTGVNNTVGSCGVGFIVSLTYTGTNCSNVVGGALGAGDPAAESYWGLTSTGNYDPAFAIESTSPTATEFEVSLAGNASQDAFGVYDFTAGKSIELFSGAPGSSDTASLTLSSGHEYGFWLTDGATGVTYDSVTGSYNNIQHFALFATDNRGCVSASGTIVSGCSTNNFYVGAEDQGLAGVPDPPCTTLKSGQTTCSDYDYNDMVVHFTAVPEPGSLPVLVTGFAGLVLVVRRRLQAKNKK